MIAPDALRHRLVLIDRSSDRLVALSSIAIAVAFLVAGVFAMLLPPSDRLGAWLPIHLALAGGATTAIAGVMPFFVAAFAAAPPSDARLRAAAVGCISLGSVVLVAGVEVGLTPLALGGGAGFLLGIVLTAGATIRPLGRALGPSRGLVTRGYLVAIVEVAVGAGLATLFVAGWPPVVEAWTRLKPAHAWLNLVGFVSLVIATTMLHFLPTVFGARISVHPSARLTVVALATGAAVVAFGFASASDLLVRLGALDVLVGSVALAIYAGRTWLTRATWTTDPGWHRFAIGGLVSSLAWYELGITIAAGRLIVGGAVPAAWAVEAAIGPIVFGWVGLAIVASASHLVPAVGPGDPLAHARQRSPGDGRIAAPRAGGPGRRSDLDRHHRSAGAIDRHRGPGDGHRLRRHRRAPRGRGSDRTSRPVTPPPTRTERQLTAVRLRTHLGNETRRRPALGSAAQATSTVTIAPSRRWSSASSSAS